MQSTYMSDYQDRLEDAEDTNQFDPEIGTNEYKSLYEKYFDLLPPELQDVMSMAADGKRQCEIGSFLGLTQGAISHRLAAAQRRIKELATKPECAVDPIQWVRSAFGTLAAKIIELMDKHECQLRVAEILNREHLWTGVTQTSVRYWLHRIAYACYALGERDVAAWVHWVATHSYVRGYLRPQAFRHGRKWLRFKTRKAYL
jgi:hypothetical protein